MEIPSTQSHRRMTKDLFKKGYICLAVAACSLIYCAYIYATYSNGISDLTLIEYDLFELPYIFMEPVASIVFMTVIYLAMMVSSYFAITGGQKERLVWTGLLLAYMQIYLWLFAYYVFIILMLIEFLFLRGESIEYRPVKERDNRILPVYFVSYSVLLAVIGYINIRQHLAGKALIIAILISLPVIVLLCSFAGYLIMRKNRWGYILAVVLLLMNCAGVVPQFRKSIDYAIIIISALPEPDLTLAPLVDTLKNALKDFGVRYLFRLPSFMAVFLAVFILKRMRPGGTGYT